MDQLFGTRLQSRDGTVLASSLNGTEFVLVYFTASWCGPCQAFTSILKDFYSAVNSSHKVCEVVVSSWDTDERQFTAYYHTMPWLAIPFSERSRRETLKQLYEVEQIPTLILLNSDGTAAVSTCRDDVQRLGVAALEDWALYKT
jgi:nucleoredoxin